jgi:hypothetical protein
LLLANSAGSEQDAPKVRCASKLTTVLQVRFAPRVLIRALGISATPHLVLCLKKPTAVHGDLSHCCAMVYDDGCGRDALWVFGVPGSFDADLADYPQNSRALGLRFWSLSKGTMFALAHPTHRELT